MPTYWDKRKCRYVQYDPAGWSRIVAWVPVEVREVIRALAVENCRTPSEQAYYMLREEVRRWSSPPTLAGDQPALPGMGDEEDAPYPLNPPLQKLRDKQNQALELKFHSLVAEWRKATQHFSSIKRKTNHPAHQGIIAMGREILPLLFHELNTHRDHLLVALTTITGVDPAPEGATFGEAVDAWLAWGREKGYLPRA